MSAKHAQQSLLGGEVRFWIEQESSIHLKAASPHGDPVELTASDARRIGLALVEAARVLDGIDSGDPAA